MFVISLTYIVPIEIQKGHAAQNAIDNGFIGGRTVIQDKVDV